MSLVHMFLRRVADSGPTAQYVAVTADIPGRDDWREVARIDIYKADKRYEFCPLNEWVGEKLVPPQLYALSEPEFQERYHAQYQGYGWGAWTSRIHSWVTDMIRRNRYPASAPIPSDDLP